MEQATSTTDTPVIEEPAVIATMHPAAEKLCRSLDEIDKDAEYGDLRKATSRLASEFAAYLRTPD